MKEYQNKEWLEIKLKQYSSGLAISKATNYPVTSINRYIRKYNLQHSRNIQPNRKYPFNESFFENIDTEEKAYWYGFFMADGCMYHGKTSYDIQFALAIEDIEHLKKFQLAIRSEKGPDCKKQGDKDVAFYRISSKKMYEDLLSHGSTPRKTGKEKFPDIQKELLRHFIRGVFDGDGSFYVDVDNYITCAFVITCSNKEFIDDILSYFKNLYDMELNIIYQNNAYSIRTTGKEKCFKIYNHIYREPVIYLDRKYELVQNFLNEYSPQCERFH